MIIGCPKEIKVHEYRVGLTPSSASELIRNGHEVIIETNAGVGIGISDADYEAVSCSIIQTAEGVFEKAEMIVKVKEPQLNECAMLKPHHLLFTYLHLAADKPQTEALMASGCTAIAYETVTADDGSLPLLAPMSEVAGRMSIQAGAHALQKASGGRGILLGGVPGVAPAKVVVIGGGVSGMNAAEIAVGLGADVTVFDRDIDQMRYLDQRFRGSVKTVYSTAHALEEAVLDADLVVGAVLVAGAAAPKLVSAEIARKMKTGAVLVDISIDQAAALKIQKQQHIVIRHSLLMMRFIIVWQICRVRLRIHQHTRSTMQLFHLRFNWQIKDGKKHAKMMLILQTASTLKLVT